MKLLKTSLFLLFIALISSPLYSAEIFHDLDGDGINDNIIDIDNNGIPDEFQSKVKTVSPATTFSVSSFLTSSNEKSENPVKLDFVDQFTLKSFVCRSLSSCRSDVESDFAGSISGASSSSGGCAGGICF